MSGLPEKLIESVRETSIEICWTQWVGMGGPASPTGPKTPRSIVDPEALVACSLWLVGEERRFQDLVAWWARAGSSLTSVQRFRSLSRLFPRQGEGGILEDFAQMALESGDNRWAPYVGQAQRETAGGRTTPKGGDEPRFLEPCTLWVRLRAGLGVGAKADILAFLLGYGGHWASAKTIATATLYSGVTIRKAAGEMALAGLIRRKEGRPSEYRAPHEPWWELLRPHPAPRRTAADAGPPLWRYWSEMFVFLADVWEWSRLAIESRGQKDYVVASRARDLMEKHRRTFALAGIRTSPPEAFPGRRAPDGLAETVEVVLEWMKEAL